MQMYGFIDEEVLLLKARYKGKLVDVWKISKTDEPPEWIKDYFSKGYLVWHDNRLKVLLKAIDPSPARDIKLSLFDTIQGSYYGGYDIGDIGDFFDATNGRIISKKTFYSQYVVESK